jgi:hypothetical protein
MNWKQLYTAATPAEREELLLEMFRLHEARQNRVIFVPLSINAVLMGRGQGWGLLRERRRETIAHFIGDRRLQSLVRRRKTLWTTGLSFAAIVTWSVAAFEALHAQPIYGAFLVIGFDLLLATVLLIKPYLRWRPASIHA